MFDAQGLFTELYDWMTQTDPEAIASIQGVSQGEEDFGEEVTGVVYFFQTEMGVLMIWSVGGLPIEEEGCGGSIFAMHIHNGESCDSPGTHYDPYGCPHPYHAGDLPPLFSNGGYAFGGVLTTRFGVEEVIGKPIVVHAGADDFTSQPSGDAGKILGCGMIRRLAEDRRKRRNSLVSSGTR